MPSFNAVLCTCAQTDPTQLPITVLFSYTPQNVAIYAGFPKANFHFLALPHLPDKFASIKPMSGLRSLLNGDKEYASSISSLKETAVEGVISRHSFASGPRFDFWAPVSLDIHLEIEHIHGYH